MVARNLELEHGDEILSTNHEYGAMDRTWRYIARRLCAKYINQPVPLPVTTQGEFLEMFWEGVTERTKVIFVSHITSPTALTFPVVEICEKARQARILSNVDGAHLPGQIPLGLGEVNDDIYKGDCHKWLCASKGAAFLFARKEVQEWLDPLVESWRYEADKPTTSQFIDYHEWQGTRDMSAFLSVSAAFVGAASVEFVRNFSWTTLEQLIGAAIILLSLSLVSFHRGLRRYVSGSAIQVQLYPPPYIFTNAKSKIVSP